MKRNLRRRVYIQMIQRGMSAPIALLVLASFGAPNLYAQIDFINSYRDKKVTAVYVDEESVTVDGELDEAVWDRAEPAKDFIQAEPRAGEPASEQTEVRLLYDRNNLYVGAICFDSEGEKGLIVQDMKRDFSGRTGDIFQVVLDTFDDNRNSFAFGTNPKGSKRDTQTGGDGNSFNRDWDGVWHVQTRITDRGWQAEFAIPFKTLRFNRQESQVWGVNFSRRISRRNERTYWAPVPLPYRVYRVSMAGQLDGINNVRQGRNLYVKPYVAAPIVRREGDDVDFLPDAGLDIKYGVTSGLTLDLTANTDFSQVEADDAQVNFTRFDLFFPEKREFFLENAEIFEFGNVGRRGFGGGRRTGRSSLRRPRNDLIPFFSRRIGISDDGDLIPVLGGARLTGRAGQYRLGIISMQQDDFRDISSTNFTVSRVRRDMFGQSDIGVLFVNKEGGDHFNRTYGVDANFNFLNYLFVSSYVLNSDTPEIPDKDGAGFFRVAWQDRLFNVEASHVAIEENFNAEVGFVPRGGYDRDEGFGRSMRKTSGEFNLTPRPEGRIPWVREFRPTMEVDYITDWDNNLETRDVNARFSVGFNDSSFFSVGRRSTFERLVEEDEVLDEPLAPGDYQFEETALQFSTDPRRVIAGSISWSDGEFYNGERTNYGVGVTLTPNPQFALDLFWNRADITLPTRVFSTDLVASRIAYSFNTNMFLNALVQYSSRDGFVASNIRFNLIHRPLSDFFLVYNESRTPEGEVIDRALIAKFTYLFSF